MQVDGASGWISFAPISGYAIYLSCVMSLSAAAILSLNDIRLRPYPNSKSKLGHRKSEA